MKTFKYGIIAKIIYRYANIPANLILLFYLLASAIGISADWKFVFPLLINIILIYVLNRFYYKIYKTFPFKIEVDNEKMICSDFVINNRIIELNHSSIKNIKGGIFSGRNYSTLYIYTETLSIGISPDMKDLNKFLTVVLTNIRKELYEELLESIKKIAFKSKKPGKKN